MRNHSFAAISIFIVLVTTVAFTTAGLSNKTQGASGRSPQQPANVGKDNKKADEAGKKLDKLPITDYEAPEPTHPNERARRYIKGKKYNEPGGEKISPSRALVGATRNDWEWGLQSTLPAAQSSTVLVGRVVGAQAHLSEDKTAVYSEYVVKVEEVLKNDYYEVIAEGDAVAVERRGGRVRLPSGAVSSFYITGQNPFQVGHRYVLFLGYNPKDANISSVKSAHEMNRHVLTGYGLRGGRVLALDAAGGRNFHEHDGKEEAAFLNEIRHLISMPPSAPPANKD